jgi:hypothetical protein
MIAASASWLFMIGEELWRKDPVGVAVLISA